MSDLAKKIYNEQSYPEDKDYENLRGSDQDYYERQAAAEYDECDRSCDNEHQEFLDYMEKGDYYW